MIFLGREITEQRNYGDSVADTIDQEINDIINEAHDTAKRILTDNRERLNYISALLIAKEGLEGKELEEAFSGSMIDKEEVMKNASAQLEAVAIEHASISKDKEKKKAPAKKPAVSPAKEAKKTVVKKPAARPAKIVKDKPEDKPVN